MLRLKVKVDFFLNFWYIIDVKGRGATVANLMNVVAFANLANWTSTNMSLQVKELKNFSKKFEKTP